MKDLKCYNFVILAILCPFSYMFGLAKKLTTVEYTVKTKVNQEIHIVQLSDLHNLQFGENNSELIDEIKKHHPDLIFMTGDMINKDTQDLNQLKNLVIESCKIAPVYFGFGNHERVWQNSYSSDLSQIIEECGATVLENDYVDLEINGNSVRIGGYSGYYGTPHMVSDDADYQEKFWQFQRSFEDTDRLKLLLAHIPTPWVDWDYTNKYDVDVIFSGHYHGGGINVPFAGGWEFFTEARESAYCQQVWVPSMSLVLIIRRRLWWQDWFLMNRVLIWIIF